MRLLAALPALLLLAACGGGEETGTTAARTPVPPPGPEARPLPASGDTAVTAAPASEPGAELFALHCAHCHAAGPGHAGTMRLGIRLGEDQAVLTEREALEPAYVSAIVRNGLGMMPAFRPTEIDDDALATLAGWLATR